MVYVPVVEKQILWSKQRRTRHWSAPSKETVMQVSRSKWASSPCWTMLEARPAKNGKPVLRSRTASCKDDFFNYMHNVGYTDVGAAARRAEEHPDQITQFQSPAGARTSGHPDRPSRTEKAQSLPKPVRPSPKRKELAAVRKRPRSRRSPHSCARSGLYRQAHLSR